MADFDDEDDENAYNKLDTKLDNNVTAIEKKLGTSGIKQASSNARLNH